MEWCFWMAFGFVAYTYAGYPVLILLLSRLRREERGEPESISDWPRVCIVIAVYNEQDRVESKIRNLRELNYPSDRLRILFVSDGSTDETNRRLAAHSDVDFVSYPDRRGKASALNVAREHIREPVVVFTDVRQTLQPDAIRYLVATLLQPGIGVVSGELIHHAPNTQVAANIGMYWRYEKSIRRAESRFFSTAGATGALYAIRAENFVTLPADAILDDFEMPVAALRKGLRTVFETRAVIYDELQADTTGEKRRKLRTLAGNFQSFARNGWLFVPWANAIWWQFLSHKVFRLLVPYALLVMLITSFALGGAYRMLGWAQLAGYALGVAGTRRASLRQNRFIGLIVVFMELNLAATLALKLFLGGRLSARWEKT